MTELENEMKISDSFKKKLECQQKNSRNEAKNIQKQHLLELNEVWIYIQYFFFENCNCSAYNS